MTGGSGSGKSAYAEDWLKNQTKSAPMLYIATMEPFGEEAQQRILRHHELRKGKGFKTLECYRELQTLDIPRMSGILLECMSNLVANELFTSEGVLNNRKETQEKLLKGIEYLAEQTDKLVIVTNEVDSDGVCYSEETQVYQKLLGEINQVLARHADRVTEVVYGIPVVVKSNEKDVEQL